MSKGHGVGQVGPVDSCETVGNLGPSLVNSLNLSRVDKSDPSTHEDRSDISTRPGQNDKLSSN